MELFQATTLLSSVVRAADGREDDHHDQILVQAHCNGRFENAIGVACVGTG
jgi:hypothetical protein